MKTQTTNEYGTLNKVLLGGVENFSWPIGDKKFDASIKQNDLGDSFDYTVEHRVLSEARDDLNRLQEVLEKYSVEVHRPLPSTSNWAYSARDIIFTYKDKILQAPTPYESRSKEYKLYKVLDGVDIIEAPRPVSPTDPMFDAANICKFDDCLLYLESNTGNREGADWLSEILDIEVVTWNGVYVFAHIDSTLVSLNKDTIMLNATRVKPDQIPRFLKDKKIIWVNDIEKRSFVKFPYASHWIGMNILSLDPETVIVDEIQTKLIQQLKENKFKVIALPMRQSRTLGGGFHCVTCDLERECG